METLKNFGGPVFRPFFTSRISFKRVGRGQIVECDSGSGDNGTVDVGYADNKNNL